MLTFVFLVIVWPQLVLLLPDDNRVLVSLVAALPVLAVATWLVERQRRRREPRHVPPAPGEPAGTVVVRWQRNLNPSGGTMVVTVNDVVAGRLRVDQEVEVRVVPGDHVVAAELSDWWASDELLVTVAEEPVRIAVSVSARIADWRPDVAALDIRVVRPRGRT